jgi:hypothetical protein
MNARSELAPKQDWVRMSRFVVRGVLGEGGSAVVFHAFDRELARDVALKVLREPSPSSERALRLEYRALQKLARDGVVRAFELFADEPRPCFSMERIEGEDLTHYVRASGRCDEERLRSSFASLARIVRGLHQDGFLHRDLKPSNVRVTAQGRVVLLDLGLLLDLDRVGDGLHTGDVGTPHYMAPEQAGASASTATDVYALGVILYECLTGVRPFDGGQEQILLDKQAEDPVPPRARAPVSEPLDRLCMRLLSRDPARRPSMGGLLSALSRLESGETTTSSSCALGRVPMVGRHAELDRALNACLTPASCGIELEIRAPSGFGKSAFLSALATHIVETEPKSWVLSDRCESRPYRPYQGFLRIVEQLVERLKGAPPRALSALMPPDAHLLCDVFPAFRRLSTFARLGDGPRTIDPVERRARAFVALRGFLANLAREQRVVILIDDLHWADADLLRLVRALVEREPTSVARPRIAWALASQAGLPSELGASACTLTLAALDQVDISMLAEVVLEPERERKVRQSGLLESGPKDPRFVIEALRQAVLQGPESLPADATLTDLYARRLDGLDGQAQRLIELCAVSGRPLGVAQLALSSELESRQVARTLALLCGAGLLAESKAYDEPSFEIDNGLLGALILGRIDRARLTDLHLRLLSVGQGSEQRPSAALLRHQLGSGHLEAAQRTALSVARAAEEVLAFEHAVHVYELSTSAVEGGEGKLDDLQRDVLRGLAQALSAAGHAARAAASFERAAQGAKVADALELRRLAAEHFMRSGHVEQALAALNTLLSEVSTSLPKRGKRALASMLFQRASLAVRGFEFTRKAARQISARELTAVDILSSVGSLVGLVDFVSGADFQTRAVRAALKAGEPSRIARALCTEAMFISATERSPRPRSRRMTEIAAMLAQELGDPQIEGMVAMARAAIELGESRFGASAELATDAETLFRERCVGVTWERGQAQHLALLSLMQGGAVTELVRRVELYSREALDRGDLYGWTHIACVGGFVTPLVEDDAAAAEELVTSAMARWPRDQFHVQHFFELMALTQVDLYRGGGAALSRLEAAWPDLRASMLLGVSIIEVSALWLKGLAMLAAREGKARRDPELLREIASIAKQIAKSQTPHAPSLAAMMRAQLCVCEGRIDRALREAEVARANIEDCSYGLFRERLMYFRGSLMGGMEGASLKADALSLLASQGVRDPVRYVRQGIVVLERP